MSIQASVSSRATKRTGINVVVAEVAGDHLGLTGSAATDPPQVTTDLAMDMNPGGTLTIKAFGGAGTAGIVLTPVAGGGKGSLSTSTGSLQISASHNAGEDITLVNNTNTMTVSLAQAALVALTPDFIKSQEFSTTLTAEAKNNYTGFGMTAAGTSTLRTVWMVPSFYKSATNVTFDPVWSIDTINGASITNVVFSLQLATTASGSTLASPATTNFTSENVAANEAADTLHITTSGVNVSTSPGQIVSIRIDRLGDNASDTYAGVVKFIGLRVTGTVNV